MFAPLISALLLMVPINPSVDLIREHHLETAEGRTAFLTEKLVPYAAAGVQLNDEIAALSGQAQSLSSETDQEEILSLSAQVAEKMDLLARMLPSLQLALHIDEDLQQIEAIVNSSEPLTPSQQEIADRLALLCDDLDRHEQK